MFRKLIFFIFILLIIAVVPVMAQTDETIPACTEEELATLGTILQEELGLDIHNPGPPSEEGTGLGEYLQSASETELSDTVVRIHDAQYHWWTEVVPSLPRCTLAVDVALLVGRNYDEALIASALFLAGETDLGNTSAENIASLREDLINRINVALGNAQSASGSVQGSVEGSTETTESILGVVPTPGNWSSPELPVDDTEVISMSFTVSEDGEQVSSFVMSGENLEGCGMTAVAGGMREELDASLDIVDGTFALNVDFGTGIQIVLEGTFISPTQAEGTYSWICGEEIVWRWVAVLPE
jgi:hypothetical protein